MSIAGKRAGQGGKQSSLFYETIRIIKEMRCAINGRYPRWICWENVIGSFSSNQGLGFKAVLEAVIGIVEPGTEVPMPEKNRWPYATFTWGTDGVLLTELSTRNIGESPSAAVESTLSAILEVTTSWW